MKISCETKSNRHLPINFQLSAWSISECVENLFLYEGKCYTACPERSYAVIPPQGRLRSSPRDTSRSLRDLHDREASRPRAILKPTIQRACASCHFSCLKCRGPSDSECTACAPDAALNSRSATEAFCIGRVVSEEIKEQLPDAHEQKRLWVPVAAAILTSIGLIAAIVWSVMRLTRRSKEANYTYDRIAFTGDRERIMIDQDILCGSSDSDIDWKYSASHKF